MTFLIWLRFVSIIGTLWSLSPVGPAHMHFACFPRPIGKTMQRMIPGATLKIELFGDADEQGHACRGIQALATLRVERNAGMFEERLFSCAGLLIAKESQTIWAQSEEKHVISIRDRPLDCGMAQARFLSSDEVQTTLVVETATDGMAIPGLAGRIS